MPINEIFVTSEVNNRELSNTIYRTFTFCVQSLINGLEYGLEWYYCPNSHTHMHTYIHTHTCTHIHTHTHACTHKHAHTYIYTYTHVHTHDVQHNQSNTKLICDPICKNLEQSRICKNSDFCIMVFYITKAFFCSSIKSILQIDVELQG